MAGTLGPYATDYLNGRRQRREIALTTWRHARGVLSTFSASFGDRPVARLSRCDLERWLATRAPRVAPGTLRTEWGTVRAFCVWLAAEGHVRRNPAVGMRPPKVPRAVRRGYAHDDLARLWPVLPDPRAHAVVALLAGSGLRIGEVAGLELGDIDTAERTVTVRKGKGGHQREVPIPCWAMRKITAYTTSVPSVAGPLIRSAHDDRSPVSAGHLGRLAGRWLSAAGLKAMPRDGNSSHAFRRGCARRVVEADPDLRVVQYLLGHAGLTSLSPYIGSIPLAKVRAALEAGGDAA